MGELFILGIFLYFVWCCLKTDVETERHYWDDPRW